MQKQKVALSFEIGEMDFFVVAFSDLKPIRWPLKYPPVESEIHYLTEED